MLQRGCGTLMHISSLPSPFGVGDLGAGAYQFVDFLNASKQKYWQLLPLNPTAPIYGNSPYSSFSAFAVNTLFVDPQGLVDKGWLKAGDIKAPTGLSAQTVHYEKAARFKDKILTKAYDAFVQDAAAQGEYQQFCEQNALWLQDYALFVNLKDRFEGKIWNQWPQEFRDRDQRALQSFQEEQAEGIERVKFGQFVFFQQWAALKAYCQKKSVRLIGDMPIYVNLDSADVWAKPQFYKLDGNKQPMFVAGVPPDYFSETGQRWGNPVYDWEVLKQDGYHWWMDRLACNFNLFDHVRIDHFRGLVGYWEIPAAEETAVNGTWVPGPGDEFFAMVTDKFSRGAVVAEDLGVITPDVEEAMAKFEFPGMKILLFAFNGDMQNHPYLPHNYSQNCLSYTGTHDNNTVLGWWEVDASDQEKQQLASFLNKAIDPQTLAWDMICLAVDSVASVSIVPMQDYLSLNGSARMNTPATASGNWGWRLEGNQVPPGLSERIAEKLQQCGRA